MKRTKSKMSVSSDALETGTGGSGAHGHWPPSFLLSRRLSVETGHVMAFLRRKQLLAGVHEGVDWGHRGLPSTDCVLLH